jgi:chemotaxis response regulator CheB
MQAGRCLRPLQQWRAVRILAVNLPRFLGGVINEIVSRRPGLQIVGEATIDDMLPTIAKLRPDAVVLGIEAGQGGESLALLGAANPWLRVVVIDSDGHSAFVQEPGGVTREVAGISPEALLDMLSSKH